jgi:hypothetical protein
MSLQEKLLKTKEELEKSAPPEALKVIHRAINDLNQSEIMGKVLKEGSSIPDFSLPNANDEIIRSRDLIAQGPVALYFYRGVW